MPHIAYITKKYRPDSLARIQQAQDIVVEYLQKGYRLSLRQLYYQFVARDLIPNNQKSYSNLGSLISDARMTGHIDWTALEDRGRFLRALNHWKSTADMIQSAANWYRRDRWETSPKRVEVWVEKDALIGIVQKACDPLDVPYFSCRGYTSQTGMWEAAMRLRSYLHNGITPVIIHLGDHDPSGIDMTRDIRDRLKLFLNHHGYDAITVDRAALNMEQVHQYNPPPNYAKATDARFQGYVELYGDDCWELDSMEPEILDLLIHDKIREHMDEAQWNAVQDRQESERSRIWDAHENWADIQEYLGNPPEEE